MRRSKIGCIARFAGLLAGIAFALPASAENNVTFIHAGQLLDRPGQPPRGPSTIIVKDGRIAEVRDGIVEAGEGQRVVDLRDAFVLPGLIDSHVHLNGRGNPLQARMDGATRDAEDVMVTMAISARDTVEAGFTTVRDLGAPPRGIRALRDAIERGDLPGPSIVNAGQMISATAGHGDASNGLREEFADAVHAHQVNICNGPEDCRRAVREQMRLGALVIKFSATGGATSNIAGGLGQQLTDDEMKAIVDAAHAWGRKVAAHAHGVDGIKAALRAGADSIEHGTFVDEEAIALFKKNGAYLVPTMLAPVTTAQQAKAGMLSAAAAEKVGEGKSAIPHHRAAIKAGVNIAFGTDSGISRNGLNALEFALMVDRGMMPGAAIQAATVNAAKLLGREARVGSIEVGKDADIIAVRTSPLVDVRALETMWFVMKRGVVLKREGARAAFPAN